MADRYIGHEYNWMLFDQIETWATPMALNRLRATLRAKSRRKRLLLTANPGGVGHNWLKKRFMADARPFQVQVELSSVPGAPAWHRVYIPARLQDNPYLAVDDPSYVDRLRASGPEWLVRAWLSGDWNVVAGGMFDDLWSEAHHVLPDFVVPPGWTIRRAFDWGSSRPFSVGWWAFSDGSPIQVGGRQLTLYRGSAVRIAEWYGVARNGRGEILENEGTKLPAVEIAKGIVERERALGLAGRVQPGPADSAIFDVDVNRGKSIADDFAAAGVRWEPSAKGPGSRRQGWERIRALMRESLKRPMEAAGIFTTARCVQWLRTVPSLPRDKRDPDDVDSEAEDHAGDETRYLVMTPARTAGSVKVKGV